MADAPAPTLVALNLVRPAQADAFETWLRDVVAAAVRDHRPADAQRWQVLRAEQAEDGAVAFLFLFAGPDPDDWALQPLLEQALGREGAEQALATMAGMLVEEQRGWAVRPVALTPR